MPVAARAQREPARPAHPTRAETIPGRLPAPPAPAHCLPDLRTAARRGSHRELRATTATPGWSCPLLRARSAPTATPGLRRSLAIASARPARVFGSRTTEAVRATERERAVHRGCHHDENE